MKFDILCDAGCGFGDPLGLFGLDGRWRLSWLRIGDLCFLTSTSSDSDRCGLLTMTGSNAEAGDLAGALIVIAALSETKVLIEGLVFFDDLD